MLCLSLSISRFCFAQDDEARQEVGNFSLVQYEDGGEKKWELKGRTAEAKGRNVEIDELSAIMFGERSSIKLKSEKGKFDREKQLVFLEDNVVAKTTDGMKLVTDSLYWDGAGNKVFTEAEANIKKADFEAVGLGAVCYLDKELTELKKDVTAFTRGQKKGTRTIITCDGPLEVDYRKNKAIFKNNVEVSDDQGNIFADRIDVYFNHNKRGVKCVVARGNVSIVKGESVTYSEKAIYMVDQGRVILPKRPRLVIQSKVEE